MDYEPTRFALVALMERKRIIRGSRRVWSALLIHNYIRWSYYLGRRTNRGEHYKQRSAVFQLEMASQSGMPLESEMYVYIDYCTIKYCIIKPSNYQNSFMWFVSTNIIPSLLIGHVPFSSSTFRKASFKRRPNSFDSFFFARYDVVPEWPLNGTIKN